MSDLVERPWRCDVTGNPVGTDTILIGGPPCDCQGCRAAAEIERLDVLIAALEWYGEMARLARLIHSEGDKGRHALAGDGGKRAAAVLALRSRPASALPVVGEATHRHVKTGGAYTLLGIGRMQAEHWLEQHDGTIDLPSSYTTVDMREVAIYRGTDGKLWVRPREEFEDGRFVALTPSVQP